MVNRYIIGTLLLFISIIAWGANPDPSIYFDKSYAVVIGVHNYQNTASWSKLHNAENDANAMARFLKGQGFKVKKFTGKYARKSNIFSYLEDELAPKLKQSDRFVFYFSGHGNTQILGGSERGYLIPYEGTKGASTWIAMEKLQELSEKLGNARHQLFILDACFGGLFAQSTKSSRHSLSDNTPKYITRIANQPARQYLTAGGAKEKTPASSTLSGYKTYSHYTAHLLQGLIEGFADGNFDGVITASELAVYLEPRATTLYNTPRGGDFPGHGLGNFVFRSSIPAIPRTRNPEPAGSTKGNNDSDTVDWKRFSPLGVSGLQVYLELHPNGIWANEARSRIKEQKRKPPSPTIAPSIERKRTLTPEEQAQALYEWQNDIIYASSSRTVEMFLQRFPVGTHVPDAERKLEELRLHGR